MKHIYLDKFFLFFLLIIILTGNFNYFIPYFLLLLIHELGHAITGIILGYKLNKIIFYPLGGITVFNIPINIPIKNELLILIMGPIMQIIGYLLLVNIYPFITIYHYTILIFNLLPIYPLDGGKIMNLLFNYKYNYLKSFKIVFFISLIMLFFLLIFNFLNFNLNLLMMIIVLFFKLIKDYKNINYYYNRFLLERYLNNYSFKKIKYINNDRDFYKDKEHFINYIREKNYLKKYFNKHIINYEKED